MNLFDLVQSFGFSKTDTETIAIISMLVLLGNFSGGLMSNILIAFGGPIHERKITERTSFRLAMVAELIFLVYIIYYETALSSGTFGTSQIIYWGYLLAAAPLLAALGGQLTYLAFSSKIEELKQEYRDFEAAGQEEKSEDDRNAKND